MIPIPSCYQPSIDLKDLKGLKIRNFIQHGAGNAEMVAKNFQFEFKRRGVNLFRLPSHLTSGTIDCPSHRFPEYQDCGTNPYNPYIIILPIYITYITHMYIYIYNPYIPILNKINNWMFFTHARLKTLGTCWSQPGFLLLGWSSNMLGWSEAIVVVNSGG